MRSTSTKSRHHLAATILMAAAVIAFYVLNWLSPEYHDDFIYKFMIVGGSVDYSHPIRSIGDIFRSQVEHYLAVNGRSLVHFLVQLFTGLLGKQLFDVVNAAVFALFVWLLKCCVTDKNRHVLPCLVALALTLLMPRFKDTFLWMTGSINYLWSATAALIFLGCYEKQRQRPMLLRDIWVLPIAVLLGWTHEGITLPLGVSLLMLNVIGFKKTRYTQGLWMSVAFLAGACLAAFAPGTLARSGVSDGLTPSMVGLKILAGFTVLGKLKLIYIALLMGVVLAFLSPVAFRKVLRENLHLLLAVFLSLGIVFLSGFTSARTAFGLELFAAVIVMKFFGEMIIMMGSKTLKSCTAVLAVALAVFYGLLSRHAVLSWQETQRLIAQIEHTSDGIIGTREHDAGCFSSYVCTMISNDASANAVNYDPKGWPISIAAYYGCDSLVFLPQAFLDDVKDHPGRFETIDMASPYEFFVSCIADDIEVDEVRYLLFPTDFSRLPFFFRPIARRMNRYIETHKTTNKWSVVNLCGKRYLIIKKDHDLLPRLKKVSVTCGHQKSGN